MYRHLGKEKRLISETKLIELSKVFGVNESIIERELTDNDKIKLIQR